MRTPAVTAVEVKVKTKPYGPFQFSAMPHASTTGVLFGANHDDPHLHVLQALRSTCSVRGLPPSALSSLRLYFIVESLRTHDPARTTSNTTIRCNYIKSQL